MEKNQEGVSRGMDGRGGKGDGCRMAEGGDMC